MSQRQLPDLRVQRFHIDDRLRLGFRHRAKHPGRALKKLVTPLLDLVRLSGMQTCPAGNRWTSKSCASSIKVFSPLIAATATFDLKAGLVVPARSSRHGHLLARGNHAAVARKIHLSRLFSYPEPSHSNWVKALSEEASPTGPDQNLVQENDRLRRENRILKKEREVLKNAAIR